MIGFPLFLFGLLLPTQLGKHFWPPWSFLGGLSIDYLSPTLYLTDIILALILFLSLKTIKTTIGKNKKLFQLLLVFSLINLSVSTSPMVTTFAWLRLYFFLGAIIVFRQLSKSKLSLIFTTLSLGIVYSSIIGIAQFFKQSSLGGIFYYLGERTFNLSTPGIARLDLPPLSLLLRSYSTFSHPNSFAGFIVVSLLVLLFLKRKLNLTSFQKYLLYLSFIIGSLSLAFSFSKVAIIAFPLVFIFKKPKKIIIFITSLTILSVILAFQSSLSFLPQTIFHRLILIKQSLQLLASRPLLGAGLGSSLPAINNLYPSQSTNLFQPVHNIYLLLFSEVGLLPILFLVLTLKKQLTKLFYPPFFAILLTGVFDHYWLTLHQNQLLLVLVIGIALNSKANPRPN